MKDAAERLFVVEGSRSRSAACLRDWIRIPLRVTSRDCRRLVLSRSAAIAVAERELLGIVSHEREAALFFEPVTLLRHRVAWFIKGRAGLISSLLEIRETVAEADGEGEQPNGRS
jgi:hypothetical protein